MNTLACLVVGIGSSKEVQIPIPVIGGSEPTCIPFASTEADAVLAAYERDASDLFRRAADHFEAFEALRRGITPLIEKGENEKALARVTSGITALKAGDQEVAAALALLRPGPAGQAASPNATTDLQYVERVLNFVRERFPELEEKKRDLADARLKSQDPARFEKELQTKDLQDRVRAHLADGEVPQALDLLDRLYQLTMQETAKTQREALAKEWEPKDAEHAAARNYIANDWRRVAAPEEFATAIPKVRDAVLLFRKHQDQHGLRGFLASLNGAYSRLKEQLDLLEGGDKKAISDVNKAKMELDTLDQQVRAALGGK
jgi:predicted GIY-YIG superfamily endonuclease